MKIKYSTPKLEEYGAATVLTLGQGQGQLDNSGGNGQQNQQDGNGGPKSCTVHCS